jgi:hypothetical protein
MLKLLILSGALVALSTSGAAAWTPVPLQARPECALSSESVSMVASYINRAAQKAVRDQRQLKAKGFSWFAFIETDAIGSVASVGAYFVGLDRRSGALRGTHNLAMATASADLPQMQLASANASCEFKALKFLVECRNSQARLCASVHINPVTK